ncbi:pentatricopeptide repeat-containing protein At4g16835, mitochondrial-like [Amborella trichopoda]|uniref:pentatricopeptide repeat-containing protein At4g16835, mitochondrial-like n=1 Tax=Amborella trichopoda TaxID=13333 RepID=UPI0009BE4190|nr:pentatricopeptide repeat-containing protein At4g16835, mitochondrial-like [Amborella trichopoda]|eukprot:XP_020518852.1 pentatricopeptide repeat-containing protein At4g16835, mitochondrial-like [Amborella trichopoda]
MFTRRATTRLARQLLDETFQRTQLPCNSTMASLISHGHFEEALQCFIDMPKPCARAHVQALNACSSLSNPWLGRQVHARLVHGLAPMNPFVLNALLGMYAKCGGIKAARQIFDEMPQRNVVSWNAMIAAYLKNSLPRESLNVFLEMKKYRVQPDAITLSSALTAYLRLGFVMEASDLFDGMTENERDGVSWTAMISGYVQNGVYGQALKLFVKMLGSSVRPDSFTLSSVVSACAGLACVEIGKAIHAQAMAIGFQSDLLVSSALLNMYAKCGEVGDSWVLFELMRVRNVVSWNAMITGFAQNGRDMDAIVLYEKMLQSHIKPDDITFVGVLSACGHERLLDEGLRYFHSISELHGMAPSPDHYACIINLLGHFGKLEQAMELIMSMPNKPNYIIWSTLLSICKINGNIELAEVAARHIFELNPQDSGPYIMLSNMYAACERWGDVASIRKLMKDRNVKKSPAYSSIEINNQVHTFLAEDRTHPQTQMIYRELRRLVEELREAGYVHDTNFVLQDVGEREKLESICYHSEKLALAFGLISKPHGIPIRIMKNIRVCGDCHLFIKLVSRVSNRSIILRDSNRFHHFSNGECSCRDAW